MAVIERHTPARRMCILLVTTFFPNRARPHRTPFLANLARALSKRCHVRVVAPVPWAPPVARLARWNVNRLVPGHERISGLSVLHPRYLVLPKLDLLSGLGYFFGVFRILRRLCRQRGRYALHAHCAYPDGVGVAVVARILHVPYFITAHGSDLNVYARRWLIAPQVRWALLGAAGVITVSDALRRKAEQITRGKLRRLECIPCAGFDPAVFYPRQAAACRASLGLPQLGRIVVFVGNMVPIKGVDVLIDAWVALAARGVVGPQDRMVLIGDGTHRAAWKERAHRAGASAPIEFPGALSQETVSGWVGAANVLCLPSHHEGMPNVIVESLASGVPVVASRVGGLPELVKEGTNGLLVPPGAPSLLAAALADALAREWDQGKIAESVAHLTWDAIASRNLEFLEVR